MYSVEKAKELCESIIVSAMGWEYVSEHNGNICLACGKVDDDTYQYFAGFDDINHNNEPFKGWSVYALIYVDLKTLKVKLTQYGLPSVKKVS